jgi:hypothetical protein
MGLDMYAFTTRQDIPPTDFDEPGDCAQLFYWRKHPNLHGWMQNLYFERGGANRDFNCSPVRLDPVHLDALEKAVFDNELPFTAGFFFGQSRPEDQERDLEFIRKARDAFKAGKQVFYTSWWYLS